MSASAAPGDPVPTVISAVRAPFARAAAEPAASRVKAMVERLRDLDPNVVAGAADCVAQDRRRAERAVLARSAPGQHDPLMRRHRSPYRADQPRERVVGLEADE